MSKTIYLNNLVKNSNFNSTNDWITSGNSFSVKTNIASIQAVWQFGGITQAIKYNIGHTYYFRVDSNTLTTSPYFGIHKILGYDIFNIAGDGTNNWRSDSRIFTCPSDANSTFGVHICDAASANWQTFYCANVLLVDLTACFGFGNEPDQAWCDANIPYFASEMTFSFPDTTEKTTNFVDVYNADYISLVKASVIKPKFKIELLDLYENTIGEITKDISADNSGSISINYQQGVRRSCSFTLSDTFGKYRPMSNDNIFGFNTKFKIYVGLENIQTGETYWFSQGIFYTTNPTSSHANSNKTVTVNGVDKFGVFTSDTGYNQLEGTYIVPAKSKLYAVVKDILSLELGNGYMIDPKEPHIDAEFIDYELPYDIKKSPGSYMGDILIELGNVLGADIFYDTNGILNITSGTTDITYSKQSSIWDFSDVLPEYSNGSVSLNTIDAINIVKVVGNQVNDSEIYIGNAENHNPLSPTAIEKIGRKIYYEESANLPNQARADEYAKYVLNSKSIIQTAIGFSSTLIPHLDVNRVITITDDYYKYEQERFIIQSITLPLDSKTLMSISCNNIASLPYYDLRNGG